MIAAFPLKNRKLVPAFTFSSNKKALIGGQNHFAGHRVQSPIKIFASTLNIRDKLEKSSCLDNLTHNVFLAFLFGI